MFAATARSGLDSGAVGIMGLQRWYNNNFGFGNDADEENEDGLRGLFQL